MWRMYLIAGVGIAVAIAAAGLWGYIEGKTACQTSQLKAVVEAQKDHEKLETKIIRLADPDLDERLSRWMRD
jgi:hypothetical protein